MNAELFHDIVTEGKLYPPSAMFQISSEYYIGAYNNTVSMCKQMLVTIINIHQMDELIKLSKKYNSSFVYFSDVSGVWGNFRWHKHDAVK